MRVLVTGGAGFIGSHLAEYHVAKGDDVRVVDDLSTGSLENILPLIDNPRFRFHEADILTWPDLPEAAAWADRIYHMAAVVGVYRCLEEPINVLLTNIMGGEKLLKAARASYHGQQIIVASSSEVYGHGAQIIRSGCNGANGTGLSGKIPPTPLGRGKEQGTRGKGEIAEGGEIPPAPLYKGGKLRGPLFQRAERKSVSHSAFLMKRESGANGSSSHEIVNLSPCEMLDRAKMDDEILYPTGVFHENMILSIDAFNASLRTNYPISKLALEALGVSYAKEFGMRITVVRLFNTTGPRQIGRYGMVAPRFVAQAVAGEPITVYGDGTQCRCFCDVRDVVLALDMLASNPSSAGEIVNVGHNREISIRKLAELVKERAGSDSPIRHVPQAEAYGRKFEETYHRRPSLEKLFRLTGFKHKWTLEQTLDVLIEIERRSPRVSEADTRWQRSHIS